MAEEGGKSDGRGRRRRTGRRDGKSGEPRPEGAVEEKRERVPFVPFPESDVGRTRVGTVVVTVRNSRYHFGFISAGMGEAAEDITLPRIYFNPSSIPDPNLQIYRGYEVEFTISKDENGRQAATNIKLTPRGEQIKIVKDAEAAARKAERQREKEAAALVATPAPAAAEGALEGDKRPRRKRASRNRRRRAAGDGKGAEGANPPREPRPPRPPREARPPREPREREAEPRPRKTVAFNVRAEGSATVAQLSFPTYLAIGRLKALAAKAVGASLENSVYLLTKENPRGVFLTRAVLNEVEDGATILLTPRRPEDVQEEA